MTTSVNYYIEFYCYILLFDKAIKFSQIISPSVINVLISEFGCKPTKIGEPKLI